MKLSKIWLSVGALCLAATSSIFADNQDQNDMGGRGYNMSSTSSQGNYQRGTFREITPNAGPRVAHGADVFITADFIWWKATEEGLEYALTGVNPNAAASTAPADLFTAPQKGESKSVGEDWAPGFKVGLGLSLGHDGWDVYTQYTWLHANDSNSISSRSSTDIVAFADSLSFQGGSIFTGNKASSRWDMHFNAIDLELGRNFYLSQFLTMRPHIGLKGTWQDHDWKSSLNGQSFFIQVNNGPNQSVTGPVRHNKEYDVWSIGIRGGFNIAWYMSKCWSIYGNLAFSTLWTNYYKQTEYLATDNTSTGTTETRVWINTDSDNLYTCKYVGELELGLRYEIWFYDDNYHFAIQAGWEQQVWVNWSQFAQILDNHNQDLALQGLNLKFRFDF
jgi:hypothetical protein